MRVTLFARLGRRAEQNRSRWHRKTRREKKRMKRTLPENRMAQTNGKQSILNAEKWWPKICEFVMNSRTAYEDFAAQCDGTAFDVLSTTVRGALSDSTLPWGLRLTNDDLNTLRAKCANKKNNLIVVSRESARAYPTNICEYSWIVKCVKLFAWLKVYGLLPHQLRNSNQIFVLWALFRQPFRLWNNNSSSTRGDRHGNRAESHRIDHMVSFDSKEQRDESREKKSGALVPVDYAIHRQ